MLYSFRGELVPSLSLLSFARTFGPKQSRAVLRELFVHILELFGYALAADRRSRADTRLQQSWDQGCQLML